MFISKKKKKKTFSSRGFLKTDDTPNRQSHRETLIQVDIDSVGQVLVSSSESHYLWLCHPVSELSTDIWPLYNGFIWINKCEPLCIHVSK